MDFDEYEYLEKTVEIAEPPTESNGNNAKGDSKRKSDEDGYSRHERSKRPKSGDEELERREKTERGHGVREKSRDREKSERHRDRERDHERHRDRDRDREFSERDKRRSSRDLDKEYDRERGKSSDRRSHSRSRDYERHHDRDREREGSRFRERDRDHDAREREGSRFRERDRNHGGDDREHRHSKEKREKKEEVTEPEADPERDQRTVFAYQISLKADERDVYDFFSRAGKVRDVRLIMDRNSRRSKGVGYIEFYDAMSVPMAITLTGQLLLGQPVMVKPSEAEKNLVPSTSTAAGTGGFMGPYSGGARRLYVGNLHPNMTETQLKQVFEPFGAVELVQLPLDPDTGNCKGFGFVQYAKLDDARAAQLALNGILELGGKPIKVVANSEQMPSQDATVAPGELDDDDGGGLSLTARSRAILMQKLDRSGTVSSITAAVTAAPLNLLPGVPAQPSLAPLVPGLGLPGIIGLPTAGLGAVSLATSGMDSVGAPTDCLLLKNMFDPRTETEPDFDLDIKDEVQSECSKFGVVKHIFVDKSSAGHVYLRFDSVNAAMAAQRALHGRWFAGKMISTSFLTPQVYEGKFPESK